MGCSASRKKREDAQAIFKYYEQCQGFYHQMFQLENEDIIHSKLVLFIYIFFMDPWV